MPEGGAGPGLPVAGRAAPPLVPGDQVDQTFILLSSAALTCRGQTGQGTRAPPGGGRALPGRPLHRQHSIVRKSERTVGGSIKLFVIVNKCIDVTVCWPRLFLPVLLGTQAGRAGWRAGGGPGQAGRPLAGGAAAADQ